MTTSSIIQIYVHDTSLNVTPNPCHTPYKNIELLKPAARNWHNSVDYPITSIALPPIGATESMF